MTLTVYSMGDMPIFTSVLNAVAMVFNSSLFDPTQGAGVVVMGLLLGIIWMILPAMGGGKIAPAPFIFALLLFYAGVVPRERLQVEDIYSGQITAVDNIPLIVALPASLSASVTRAVTDKVETAFQLASGSYIAMGAEGFVNPLKLMLSLRDPNQTASAFPYLSMSITEFVKYCAPTDPLFSFQTMESSPNIIAYLATLNVRGIMTYWDINNSMGVGESCLGGQTRLTNDTASAQMQADATVLLKTSTAGEFAQSDTALGASIDGMTQAYNSVTAGILGNMQDSQSFIINAIAMMPARQGVNCINQPEGPNMSDCMSNVVQREAMEKQNMDSAAQAGIFTKTMIPGMNLLLALFYAFSPIVIAIAFMAGPHGVKMIVSLLLFGIWSQTWMPIAAVINYMIQLQTQYAFSSFPATGMTMQNYMQFYSILTMKLGMASTMMAMVPMLSMALLSGSMMALTSVAGKMDARDYTDENKVAPSVGSNDAVVKNGSMIAGHTRPIELNSSTGAASGWDTARNGEYNPLSKVNLSETQQKSYEHAQANSRTAQSTVDQKLANTLTSGMNQQQVTEWSQGVGRATAATDSNAASMSTKWVSDLAKTEGMTKEDKELLTVGVGASLLGNEATAKKAFGMMKNQSVVQKITDTKAFSDEKARVHKEESNRSFGKNLRTNAASVLSNDNTNSVSTAITASEKADETLKRSESRTKQVGMKNEQDMQTMGAQAVAKIGAGTGEFIDAAVPESERAAYQTEEKRLLHNLSSSGAPVTRGAQAAAKLQALHSVDADAFMGVLQTAELGGMHSNQEPAGADVGALNTNLQVQASHLPTDHKRVERIEHKAAAAANLHGSGGASIKLVEGNAAAANSTINKSTHDKNHLGAGGEIGRARVQAQIDAHKKYQDEVDGRAWTNEHGDIAGMANFADAGRQMANFSEDQPLATAAIMATPIARVIKGAEIVGEAALAAKTAGTVAADSNAALRAAQAGERVAQGGGSAKNIANAEKTVVGAEKGAAKAAADLAEKTKLAEKSKLDHVARVGGTIAAEVVVAAPGIRGDGGDAPGYHSAPTAQLLSPAAAAPVAHASPGAVAPTVTAAIDAVPAVQSAAPAAAAPVHHVTPGAVAPVAAETVAIAPAAAAPVHHVTPGAAAPVAAETVAVAPAAVASVTHAAPGAAAPVAAETVAVAPAAVAPVHHVTPGTVAPVAAETVAIAPAPGNSGGGTPS